PSGVYGYTFDSTASVMASMSVRPDSHSWVASTSMRSTNSVGHSDSEITAFAHGLHVAPRGIEPSSCAFLHALQHAIVTSPLAGRPPRAAASLGRTRSDHRSPPRDRAP